MITVEMLRKILFYFLYTVQLLLRFSLSYIFFKAGTVLYKTTNKHFIILTGEPYFT